MGRIVDLCSQGGIMLSIGSAGWNSGRLFPWGEPCVLLCDSWQYLNLSRQAFRITLIFSPTLSTAGYGTGGARITYLDTFFVEWVILLMRSDEPTIFPMRVKAGLSSPYPFFRLISL